MVIGESGTLVSLEIIPLGDFNTDYVQAGEKSNMVVYIKEFL